MTMPQTTKAGADSPPGGATSFFSRQKAGGESTIRWHLVVAVTLGLFLLQPAGPNLAAEEADEATTTRIKIRRLEHGIQQQLDQLQAKASQERSILNELQALDQRLSQQQERLAELEAQISGQQQRIDQKEASLQTIRAEKTRVEEHLQKRAIAYYTMGNTGLLNVTFSTKSLPELLTFNDAFETLINYDQEVIRVYRQTIVEQERVRSTLALEKVVLEDFYRQAQQERDNLEATKSEKNTLLTQVRTQSSLHQQAVREMEEASRELAQAIVAGKTATALTELSFAEGQGALPPPVEGTVLTLFQQERTNKLGIVRQSKGIELLAEEGAEVVAVAAGEVIFSGYLRGYGNAIIIDHGEQYVTVTARIEQTLVEKGQRVAQREVVGAVGVTATLFNDGVYFEIRHGRESLDPLLWLDPEPLQAHLESADREDHPGGQR
ncbi:MAG: peptidoglycan DD-metalloendopeptidase family protein [Desulforhopalus sp.]|nr:peptidoglycan DD-metalloendopeptidase family protein [Desulforhopalus sp.]